MESSDPPFVIHVRRGDARLSYPVTVWEMVTTDVFEFAWRAATDFIRLQQNNPDRPELIDVHNTRTELVLKVPNRDRELSPFLRLRSALEGHWQEMDVKQMITHNGEIGLRKEMGRARVVILDLVDRRR